jgi:hypothetical protein
VPRFALARRHLALAALALPFALLAGNPTWAQSLGLDVWNVPALQDELRTGEGTDRQLTDQSEEVRRRIAVKDAIITELLDGQITLAEATDRFTALNAGYPEYLLTIRATQPGDTDREKFARNVIAFARLRTAPDQVEAVTSRLEGELQEMTGAGEIAAE